MNVPIDSSTHYPALYSWAALPDSYPNAWVPSRETVCTIFMMVFGMTRLGCEPTTYCMRWHANHLATPMRSTSRTFKLFTNLISVTLKFIPITSRLKRFTVLGHFSQINTVLLEIQLHMVRWDLIYYHFHVGLILQIKKCFHGFEFPHRMVVIS